MEEDRVVNKLMVSRAMHLALWVAIWTSVIPPSTAPAEDAPTQSVTGAVGIPPAPPASGGPSPSSGPNVPRPLESTSMEDLLLEKGLITLDDWIRIKAEEEQHQSERSVVAEFTGSPRWYERLTMFGYGQMRYNESTDGRLRTYQDASVGGKDYGAQPGFFFRRVRWVVTGQISDHVSVYIQPDMASNIDGNTHALSMRDAFGDWNFDKEKEYRLRLGLQRIPCSFDNWQASRVRMAIDRADATNSCAPSERDIGIAFMWTPKVAQQRYKQMLDYMYGPGDYGVFNITVDNAQGLNNPERNKDKRVSVRLSWPFELPGGRLMEVGTNVNRGMFNVAMGAPTTGTTLFSRNETGTTDRQDYRDERANVYIYFPPQPWGFIAEYVTGRGPRRGADGVVRESHLYGGYVQAHYQWKYSDMGLANFYTRYQEYYGGLKFLTGAPDARMKELETGIAWQPDPQWEFTVAYASTQRVNVFNTVGGSATVPPPQFDVYGHLIRFQVNWFWN
jgi:hypothetical protein